MRAVRSSGENDRRRKRDGKTALEGSVEVEEERKNEGREGEASRLPVSHDCCHLLNTSGVSERKRRTEE